MYHVKYGSQKWDVPWDCAPHFDFRALDGKTGSDAKALLDAELSEPHAGSEESLKKIRDYAEKHRDDKFEVSWD